MTKLICKFTVYGTAQPAGSKRAFPFKRRDGSLGVAVSHDSAKTKPWMAEVKHAAREAYSGPPVTGPVELSVVVYRRRPASHYGSGKNAALVKPSAPEYPMTKPDLTKLVRAIEDALTGIVWRDDGQVVRQINVKRFTALESECVEVAVYELE